MYSKIIWPFYYDIKTPTITIKNKILEDYVINYSIM